MRYSTLVELLRAAAAAWPINVAVGARDRDLVLRYRELDGLVSELAAEIRRRGVGEGDTVVVLSDNCVELVLALFASISAGAAVALVDPARAPHEIASMTRAVGAKATLAPAHIDTASGAPPWKLDVPRSGRPRATLVGPAVASPRGPAVAPRRPDDVALLLFTAGTTSAPKVVPLTHANVCASLAGICETYRLSSDDATLLVMPLFHGHGLIGGLLSTLATGGAAHLPRARRFSASAFWPEMIDARATWYTAVPTIHQILLARAAAEYPKDHPPHLRFIRSSSAPLATTVLRELEATFGAPVIPAYGMTETAHQISSNPLPSVGPREPSSVGVATGGEIAIVGADGAIAGVNVLGEVCVRGPAVTGGYLDAPDASRASFVGGWFHTGDLGCQDENGYLFLRGRIKEMINRGGEKISPSAIDAVLSANPKVEEAMSFGAPDDKYGEEVAAAVILKPGQRASARELEEYSLARLSAFEVPKRFYFVDDFPRTAKGVGDRRKLAEMLVGGGRREARGS
ncbi:MAG: AMP-binding protein [Labilithrix sp.]|nr:AMP-binding protein [Labilithrix sp.]